jgi:hypothetical protein
MGITLKFLSGDSDRLTEVFSGEAYYKFDDPGVIVAEADFSLHLQPRDLNLLSIAAGILTGQAPMDLRSQLTRGVDERDHGLLYVSKEWVAYMAAVPLSSVPELAESWAVGMRKFYNAENIVVTEAMIQALNDLISLCQQASPECVPVVHVWWP